MAHVIEGTWDEIKRHEAEFAGRRLRVIVDVDHEIGLDSDVLARVDAWREFVSNGVTGIVLDDSREAIYANDLGRG